MGLKVNYKGSQLTSMDETGTKTLLTNGKYCEDNFEVVYEGSGSSGHKITLTNAGRYGGGQVRLNNTGTVYYEANTIIPFVAGDFLYITCSYGNTNHIYINNEEVASGNVANYSYTLPSCDIEVSFSLSIGTSYIYITTVSNSLEISEYGSYIADSSAPYESVVISSSEPTDAVRFFDYDGTLLYSYSKTQFLALSSMPANPSHTGLTAQGWNWSLSDAQAHVQNRDFLDVGQMYITSDGTTQIDIELHKGRLAPYLGIAVNGTVSVNWGDGSSASTVTGTSLTSQIRTQHVYAQEGNYTIKISVTSGSFAFYSTSKYLLLSANNSDVNYNYVYAFAVKSIKIGSDCNIGSYAFYNCRSLSSITIPSSVTSIGTYAFQYCNNLSSITIPQLVTSIPNYAFAYCYNLSSATIPKGVTSINNSAFMSCYNLSAVIAPNASAGSGSFSSDYNLLRRILHNYTVFNNRVVMLLNTSIESYAFSYCNYLSDVIMSSSVTSIGSYAFRNCYSLTSVTIPSSVTSIGDYSFTYCYSLTSVTIPSSVTSIGSYAFQDCGSLSSITIPSSVTSIGTYAFQYCSNLSSVTIPSSVTSIPNYAFQDCGRLSSITIPSSVTSIGNYAFYNCFSLVSVTIPSSVTSIGIQAFYQCYGVGEYHIQATTPPTLGSNAFKYISSDCKIYVPSASLSAYQSATNWATYSSQMVGE